MISVSVVLCPDNVTAQTEAGKLTADGVDVKVRQINKTSAHGTDNCDVNVTNLLGKPIFLVTAIEE